MNRTMNWKRRVVSAAPLVLGVLLAAHFGATLIHLMPMNPIKMRLQPAVDRYIEPYFSQRWELFAPDPVLDTREVLVACRVKQPSGADQETAWSNVTTPLRQLKYHYRLTPADRLERVQSGALHVAFPPDDAVLAKIRKQHDVNEEYRKTIATFDEAKKRDFELGSRLLGRVASAECDRTFGFGLTTAVRVRMLVLRSPPFSKRTLPNDAGDSFYFDFDWRPYEPVSSI
jgi:hypothetical protein